MGRIDKYILEFRQQGYKIKSVSRNSALFMKNNVQFLGRVKWLGGFEVTDINGGEKSDEIIRRLKICVGLKEKGYIDETTFVRMIETVNDSTYSQIVRLIYSIEPEITFNFPIKSDKPKSNKSKFKYLLVIIPKSSRPEFIADLQSIIAEMKADRCSKTYTRIIVGLHFISVVYHAFFFKLKGYFYTNKQQSNNN